MITKSWPPIYTFVEFVNQLAKGTLYGSYCDCLHPSYTIVGKKVERIRWIQGTSGALGIVSLFLSFVLYITQAIINAPFSALNDVYIINGAISGGMLLISAIATYKLKRLDTALTKEKIYQFLKIESSNTHFQVKWNIKKTEAELERVSHSL